MSVLTRPAASLSMFSAPCRTRFILTGDPTYITSHNQARSLICRLERDEILEELVRYYVQNQFGG